MIWSGVLYPGMHLTISERHLIDDHPLHTQPFFRALIAHYGRAAITDRLALAFAQRDFEKSNIARWADRGISPASAWRLGEALHWSDANTQALMPHASGLLGLIWGWCLGDVVGVIASCNPHVLGTHEARLLGMLNVITAAGYFSPYDEVIPELLTSNSEIQDETLYKAAHNGTKPMAHIPPYGAEARRLRDRQNAWTIWTMPPDLYNEVRKAGEAWTGLTRDQQRERVDGWPQSLKVAYAVGASNTAKHINAEIVVEYLLRWFYTAGNPEPPPFTPNQFLNMLVHPNDPEATTLLRAFRSYAVKTMGMPQDFDNSADRTEVD